MNDPPSRHQRPVRMLLVCIGVALLFSPCLMLAFSFHALSAWDSGTGERRGPPEDVEASVRSTIRFIDVAKFVNPIHPQAESVSDGFHGEGFDWYSFELSKEQMTLYAEAMRSELAHGRCVADHRPPPTDGHPPAWWDVNSVQDLEAMVQRSSNWWIGFSPARCRVYILSRRL